MTRMTEEPAHAHTNGHVNGSKPEPEDDPSAFKRFEDLARGLLKVPKHEVDKLRKAKPA